MNELFWGLNFGDRVMVAYSGGVDSSYAAVLCREAGFEVECVTMLRFEEDRANAAFAAKAAKESGFPHFTLDLIRDFREEVMHETWRRYSMGLTPNPCAVCNPAFKFGRLREFALSRNCKALVTGHYVRIEPGPVIRKAVSLEKDQSYFLFAVPQEALSFCRTPLGAVSKPQVRAAAGELKLAAVEKKESQDICFGGESLPETLSAMFPEPPVTGDFLDESGKILGRHKGVQYYTIGQRRGTGVALGKPAFVKAIQGNSIIMTTESEHLSSGSIMISGCNFFTAEPDEFECEVRTRYRSHACGCRVTKLPDNRCRVVFDSPVRAVAPGQAAVFYRGDLLLGGGWIEK